MWPDKAQELLTRSDGSTLHMSTAAVWTRTRYLILKSLAIASISRASRATRQRSYPLFASDRARASPNPAEAPMMQAVVTIQGDQKAPIGNGAQDRNSAIVFERSRLLDIVCGASGQLISHT